MRMDRLFWMSTAKNIEEQAKRATLDAAGFWECHKAIKLQLMAVMVKAWHVAGFANGDFTSGHPSFVFIAQCKSWHVPVVQGEDVIMSHVRM